jgi:hypothetical protein
MLERLGRADLVTGEAAHTVFRPYRDADTIFELVNPHRTVFYTEAAAVAGSSIDRYLYHSHHQIQYRIHQLSYSPVLIIIDNCLLL